MPTSPSPRRGARVPPPAPRPAAPAPLFPRLALIGVLAIAAIVVCVLPASIIARILPAAIRAEDFSGSLWHGSAGRLTAAGRPAGAIEWQIHPLALLGLHVTADIHWVKGGFVLDGAADLSRGHLAATHIAGGGPLEDLRDLGLQPGWRGTADVRIREVTADWTAAGAAVRTAVGDIALSDVSARQIAGGADLGGYLLAFDDAGGAAQGPLTARLTDTGGPLAVDADISISPAERRGLLSGTLKERADAPPALRDQVADLARFHARDAQGRVPVEFELSF